MSRIRTTARRTGLTAVLVVTAALGTVVPALAAPLAPAAPSGCTSEMHGGGSRSYCSTGGGEYRAAVRCDESSRPDYDRYGEWVAPGQWSSADCGAGDRPFNGGLLLR
jgi:hypothetical protein